MLIRGAIAFFALGLIALIFGYGGVAGFSMEVGKTLLIVFLVLAIVTGLAAIVMGKKPKGLP